MKIEQLGFDKWFLDRIDLAKLIDHQIARVISVNKDRYTINNGKGDVAAEVTGRLMTPTRPCVGAVSRLREWLSEATAH